MTGRRGEELVWGALSDPTRRRILDLLRERARTTSQVCAEFPQSRFAVMKHLGVLEAAGLITVRRSGRERWNAVNATPLRRIYERWLTPYQQLWAASLSRLGVIVEREADPVSNAVSPAIRPVRIDQVTEIDATPEAVFDALVRHVSRWWLHNTYDTPGRPDIRIEPHVGGRFLEVAGDKQRLYATVTRYEPGKLLWLEGPMGMAGCVFGTIAFALAPAAGGTTELTLAHQMLGNIEDATIAMYTDGWRVLCDALRAFVETGADVRNIAS